jgi:hypothetical protein
MIRRILPAVMLCCLVPAVAPSARADAEDDVRAAFAAYQAALKSGDPEKIWPLLDSDTQAAAEKVAKTYRESYEKANDTDKAKLEKSFGLKAEEMAKMTGKVYLKSKRFLGKYDEIPGSKLTKVTIKGNEATVDYTEEDGDKEKLQMVRQDGKWKVVVKIA